MNQTILDRNLLSLGASDPGLIQRLSRIDENENAKFFTSRTGKLVLAPESGGRHQPLHSLFDPEKEGLRYLENHPADGFFVFLGFGCGYQVLPFLDKPGISHILIIDKDLNILKSVLSRLDLRRTLLDPRVKFLIDPRQDELRAFILSYYIPSISGDLRTVALRPRVEQEPDFFQDSLKAIKESLAALSDDYTVQTHFGKKWFANTLSNLEAAEKSTTVLVPKRKAIVTAAGPSLELAIPEIRERRKESLLIATDTSLPALLSNDLLPDLVVSIDCQHISYNHFLQGYPEGVPLVLDLASPPILTKLGAKLIFFTSGHPFSQYVNTHWRNFPSIDTSGGNVSHAAVSLADRLGVQQIRLYGADFSYPEGKSYARGTYIYPYFRSREKRTDGLENLFVSFLFGNRNIRKVWEKGVVRYTTKPMISYKERLESASRLLSAELIPIRGLGEEIAVSSEDRPRQTSLGRTIFSSGKSAGSWKDFLTSYRADLLALPKPKNPVMNYLFSLSQQERNLWTTVLPVTAVLRKASKEAKSEAPEILEEARGWTLEILGRFLSAKN